MMILATICLPNLGTIQFLAAKTGPGGPILTAKIGPGDHFWQILVWGDQFCGRGTDFGVTIHNQRSSFCTIC